MCNKMSDVRLSNASPTLERGVDARQQDNLRPRVRRSLFGRPDPEEIQRNLDAVVREDAQAFRERYNFDPETNRPLSPGNYEWEEDDNPPDFYLRPPHGLQRSQRDADLPGDNHRQDAEETSVRRSNPQADRVGSKRRSRGALGPCSGECQSKRLHSDEDDDDEEDQSCGTGSQAERAAAEGDRTPEERDRTPEERDRRPEESAEVQ